MTGVSRFCKIILKSCYMVPVRIYSIKIPLNLIGMQEELYYFCVEVFL